LDHLRDFGMGELPDGQEHSHNLGRTFVYDLLSEYTLENSITRRLKTIRSAQTFNRSIN